MIEIDISSEFLRLFGEYIVDEVDTQHLLSIVEVSLAAATASASESPDCAAQIAVSLVVKHEHCLDVE